MKKLSLKQAINSSRAESFLLVKATKMIGLDLEEGLAAAHTKVLEFVAMIPSPSVRCAISIQCYNEAD